MPPCASACGDLGQDDSEEKQDTPEAEVVWQTNPREPRQKCLSLPVGRNRAYRAQICNDTVDDGNSVSKEAVPERYSLAYFSAPDPATVIEALRCCCCETKPPRWKPIDAGEYLGKKKAAIVDTDKSLKLCKY